MSDHIHIGLPVYNGEAHLAEALESLLNQTHKNFELFIVDNASSDETPVICQSFAKKDSRIKYFRQKDWVCATENWNRTYEMAGRNTKIFMWASDDDLWARDYIESLLPSLIQNSKVVLSFSQADEIDMNGQKIGELYRRSWPDGNTAFQRVRSIINDGKYSALYGLFKTGAIDWNPLFFDTSFGSDLWFLIQVATKGKFHMTKRPLFYRRTGGISEKGDDPSASYDPLKTWNIGREEWDLIYGLNLGTFAKYYTFYRLKFFAKTVYPQHKKIDVFLTPLFWSYMLWKNPRSLGIRTRMRRKFRFN